MCSQPACRKRLVMSDGHAKSAATTPKRPSSVWNSKSLSRSP
jgi:hypothetical protein